ncbi:MAG: hypothetical protein HKL84_07030, partial [Acidimicrobiaceae bacterium]|nr:hypothetical protein [Acidimicrobiaceae bacterium]
MITSLGFVLPSTSAANRQSKAELSYRIHSDLLITVSDALLAISVIFWAMGVNGIDVSIIGGFGLVPLLPVVYLLAIVFLVISAAMLLSAPEPSTKRLAFHVAALLLMLYGTAPLVYAEPRYAWLYKQIGVVQYIKLHGNLNSSIDIYQNWPGYFGLAAWFDRVAGINNPLTYAAWAQLFFETLFCLVIKYVVRAKALALTWREQWLTVFIFAGANWIAQDYLSPQAFGFVLSMGVFALALHGLESTHSYQLFQKIRSRFSNHSPSALMTETGSHRDSAPRSGPPISIVSDAEVLIGLLLVYSVLVVVHELSPYIVAIQIAVLAFMRRLRRWWIAPAMMAIAIGYLV